MQLRELRAYPSPYNPRYILQCVKQDCKISLIVSEAILDRVEESASEMVGPEVSTLPLAILVPKGKMIR